MAHGREPKPIDVDVVTRMAAIGGTMEEMAYLVDLTRAAFNVRLSKDPALAAAIEKARAEGKMTLRRWQWKLASEGDKTMLIWLGKQMLHQSDKAELTGKDGGAMVTEVVYRWARPGELDPPTIEGSVEDG